MAGSNLFVILASTERYAHVSSLYPSMNFRPNTIVGLLPVCALLSLPLNAQNLPDEYAISDDGRRLVAGGLEVGGFYSEDEVKVIRLTFAQSNYWTLLEQSYDTGIPVMATLEYNGDTYDSVGVKIKGETSYFMLPPGSQKVSFDINLDEFVDGQDIGGYESFNLNNGFQDASVMRDVVYHHLIRPHVPAAKACFAQVYINNTNWGHYDLVQDLDGEFIREWWFSNDGARWRAQRPDGQIGGGQWGDGTAALNYLGADTTTYQEYYTLKNSNIDQPWDMLVRTCDKLVNTPIADLKDSLERHMDIDRVLWHLATENAFADDDSYIHKGKSDYSLYYEPETDRMVTQEIDGNSILGSMALNWSPFYNADDANYPLLYLVMQVPELRQRYLAHLRHIMSTSMQSAEVTALIAQYRSLIDTVVQADPIKLMTWAQYQSGCTALGDNCTTRRNNLGNNNEVAQPTPTINTVEHETMAGVNMAPAENEAAHVRAAITSSNGIYRVRLYWSNELPGRFSAADMFDDGAHNDGNAGDGVYGADIPGQPGGLWVRYYIAAEADNPARSLTYAPAGAEHDVWVYQVTPNVSPIDGLVINEVMANNSNTAMDESDQYEDWIEFFNGGANAVDLEGWYLTDTPFEPTKWQFPGGTVMAPGDYMIVWADEDLTQGAMHANFKLSASGESVLLYDPETLLVDNVDFTEQITDQGYARVPNGSGPFISQQPTFAGNNDVLDLPEGELSSGFRLYPNPATTQVLLVWGKPTSRAVSIIDATQRVVWSGTVRSGQPVDVSGFAGGAYVVRLAKGAQRLVVVR